jgi:hypothetical protein
VCPQVERERERERERRERSERDKIFNPHVAFFLSVFFFIIIMLVVLEIELRVSHLLGKHCTT